MDIRSYQNNIKNCQKCNNDKLCAKYLTFKKPDSYFGKSEINIIILGHSPTVRSNQQAKCVLKMDEQNKPLYKYINEEIIKPLGLNIDNCYCTNLLKCETSIVPENIKPEMEKKMFFNSTLKNCKDLFEIEISIINPKIIIGLSERNLKFVSENYYQNSLKMKENYGKLFEIKIAEKSYNYIPVIHYATPRQVKVLKYYFDKNKPDNQKTRLKELSEKII
jgi:uracil-DNA glycosylase family 4